MSCCLSICKAPNSPSVGTQSQNNASMKVTKISQSREGILSCWNRIPLTLKRIVTGAVVGALAGAMNGANMGKQMGCFFGSVNAEIQHLNPTDAPPAYCSKSIGDGVESGVFIGLLSGALIGGLAGAVSPPILSALKTMKNASEIYISKNETREQDIEEDKLLPREEVVLINENS